MTKDTRSEIMEKVGSQGDLTNLSDPEVRKLFDPDEKLSDEEVRERADRFQQERNKQSMDTPLTVSARMGMDGGDMRTIGPGEGLDDKGQIILLDPAKAEAAAERFTNADPRTAKQSMRRSAALQDLVNHLFIREEPGPSVVHLPLEKCRQLHEEYQQAKAEGYQDNQLDFIPLSVYAAKLQPEGKKPIRHLMRHEFGVFQMASNPGSPLAGRIVCVSDKDLG